MIKDEFIEPNNVIMLWEVLSDDALVKNQSVGVQEEIKVHLIKGLKEFYERYKNEDIQLVEINKRYLKEVMNAIRENYPLKLSKLTIHHNSPIESLDITNEEIQRTRQTVMTLKQEELQNDFNSVINVERPTPLNFEEDINCVPINQTDLDAIILERNNDIQPLPIDDNVSKDFQKMMSINNNIHEDEESDGVQAKPKKKNVTWTTNNKFEDISDKKKVQMFFHDLNSSDEHQHMVENKLKGTENSTENSLEIKELFEELNRIKGNIKAIEERLKIIGENMKTHNPI